MGFNLELALVIGTLVTGLVVMLDRFVFGESRRKKAMQEAVAKSGEPKKSRDYHEPWYVEYSKSFFPILLIVLILRSFIAEPFRIPSGSMIPTLLVGDFILVNKFSYGVKLPVIHKKVIETGTPERGDVAVFRYPKEPSVDYIKRIIGLPGDRIRYEDKKLYINDHLMPQNLLGEYQSDYPGKQLELVEDLGTVNHRILISPDRANYFANEYYVPEGQYFVMGDNRDNSNDSRGWGFVPEGNLVGKAFVIWMNWDFPTGPVNISRIGTTIQ